MAIETKYIAEELAEKQKEISVSEFFERNKQILGFDSPTRALITVVKEGVDNSLDACDESQILPEIIVKIEGLEDKDEYKVTLEDNGPGVIKRNVGNIFARLLYGSRFHAIRQSRGQQGIGISAAVMYGQLTTGKPAVITTKIGESKPAYRLEMLMDTKKNKPEIVSEEVLVWEDKHHGTKVEIFLNGRYVRAKKQSVLEYLKGTAIVNPYADITFVEPDGTVNHYPRVIDKLPRKTVEIKPHPLGIELGTLLAMAKVSENRKLGTFLSTEFSRISPSLSKEICEKAGVDYGKGPKKIEIEEAKALIAAFERVKIRAPDTDCLSPIGASVIKRGLKNVLGGLRPEFYAPPVTRNPSVYGGHPFQVEAGIVFGGQMERDSQVEILRFANRVPLLYQQGDCAITKTIEGIDWRNYGLDQRGGKGIPYGPAIFLVHVASTNVPYTSEAKEAVASMPEIMKEVEAALRVCARKLKSHLRKSKQRSKTKDKFIIIRKILPEIAEKSAKMIDRDVPDLDPVITKIMQVVFLEDEVQDGEGVIRVTNYTTKKQKFKLILEVQEGEVKDPNTDYKVLDEEHVEWNIKGLKPTESLEIRFKVNDDYEENIVYVEGLNPLHVLGADIWQGV